MPNPMSATFPTETALDHLVYATPDLKRSVHELAQKLGIEPSEGGRHVGRGTMNYLLGLGGGTYLELIGSDPDQRDFTGTRPFGLDSLSEPRLVSWAVQVNDIETFVRRLQGEGYDPGPISEMSRQTPEGQTLQWKLTCTQGALPTLVPFLIDWGGNTSSLSKPCTRSEARGFSCGNR